MHSTNRIIVHLNEFYNDQCHIILKFTAIQAQLYLSPTETYCMNIDYYLTGDESTTADFTSDEHTKLCKLNFMFLCLKFSGFLDLTDK